MCKPSVHYAGFEHQVLTPICVTSFHIEAVLHDPSVRSPKFVSESI